MSKKWIFSLLCMFVLQVSIAQEKTWEFTGSAGATNNGISIVPSFSLEKPAFMFNGSFKKKNYSIEPVINFSMEGKPWYMLFWLRKQYGENSNWKLNLGTHLGLNFVEQKIGQAKDSLQIIKTDRYMVFEVFPRYQFSKNFTAGVYLMQSHGINQGTLNTLRFITLYTNLTSNPTAKGWQFGLTTQPFYLNIDGQKGWYLTSDISASKRGLPVVFKYTFNKTFESTVDGSKPYLWNISVTYLIKGGKIGIK